MARYWVGGTGNWSDTSHWSLISGGAGGAPVPTSTEDVFLDANSGTGTISLTANSACRAFDCTGYAGTFDVAAHTFSPGGNATGPIVFTLASGMTLAFTGGGTISFSLGSGGTCAVTTAGKDLSSVNFTGVGGTWTIQDSFTASWQVTLTSGTLNTNNQNCTWRAFSSSNTNTRTLTLGASSITVTGTGNVWGTSTSTGLTVTASTATVTCTGTNAGTGGAVTYSGASFIFTGSGTAQFGGGTVKNLTRTGTASPTDALQISNTTITGTLTLTGNSTTNRLLVSSFGLGGQRTLTAAAVSLTNVDFMDLVGAGAAAPFTGTSLGDCQGNSGITFDSSATQTWQGTSGGNWSDVSKWTSRVPLPQDDVVVASAFTAGQSIVMDMPRLGHSINFTGSSGSPALVYGSNNSTLYGSLNLTNLGSVTASGSVHFILSGRGGPYTITTGGISLPGGAGRDPFIIAYNGTYQLGDDLSWGCSLEVTTGTFNANNHNVQLYAFVLSSSQTVNMGTGTWTLTGTGTVWSTAGTVNASTSTIAISTTGSTGVTFQGGGNSYYRLRFISTGSAGLTITGNNTFSRLDLECSTARTITLPAGGTTTVTSGINLSGASAQLLSLVSSSPGTGTTLALHNSSLDTLVVNQYVSLSSDVSMNARWWVGGTGAWDNATTTNWATVPGGSSGASVPTSTTVVSFDSNSGLTQTQTVTIGGNSSCGGCFISGIVGRGVAFHLSGDPTWSTGTYQFQGNDDATPIIVASNTTGLQRTLTINGTHGTHSNVCFQDIALAGTAGTLTGTRIGDMLGNSGITFDASTTQTWTGSFAGTTLYWSDAANWSGHIPLPQDDVVVAGTVTGGSYIFLDTAIVGRDIDFSGVSGTARLNVDRSYVSGYSNAILSYVFGKFTLSNDCYSTGSPANTIYLSARSSVNLNFGNFAWGYGIFMRAPGGTYVLQASNPAPSGSFYAYSGTLDTNGFNFTVRGVCQFSNDTGQTVTFLGRTGNHTFGGNATNNGFVLSGTGAFASGTGTWSLIGTGIVWNVTSSAAANFTGLPTILITDTSATLKTFEGGGATYNVVQYKPSGSANFTVTGNNTFANLDIECTTAKTVTLPASGTQTITSSFTFAGASGQTLSAVSSSPGTSSTISVTNRGAVSRSNFSFSSDIIFNVSDPVSGAASATGSETDALAFTETASGSANAIGSWTDIHVFNELRSGSASAVGSASDSISFRDLVNGLAAAIGSAIERWFIAAYVTSPFDAVVPGGVMSSSPSADSFDQPVPTDS